MASKLQIINKPNLTLHNQYKISFHNPLTMPEVYLKITKCWNINLGIAKLQKCPQRFVDRFPRRTLFHDVSWRSHELHMCATRATTSMICANDVLSLKTQLNVISDNRQSKAVNLYFWQSKASNFHRSTVENIHISFFDRRKN